MPSAARPPLGYAPSLAGGWGTSPRRGAPITPGVRTSSASALASPTGMRAVGVLAGTASSHAGRASAVPANAEHASGGGATAVTAPRQFGAPAWYSDVRPSVLPSPQKGVAGFISSSPVSVSGAAKGGAAATPPSYRGRVAPMSVEPPAPMAPPEPSVFDVPPTPVTVPLPVPTEPQTPNTPLAPPPRVLTPLQAPLAPDLSSSVLETQQGPAVVPPLHTRVAAAACPPRVLTFRPPRLLATDLATTGEQSITPTIPRAPSKARKAIRKPPAKPRARRAVANGKGPAVSGSGSGAAPDIPPAAASVLLSAPPGTAASHAAMPPDAVNGQDHLIGVVGSSAGVSFAAMTRVFTDGLRPVCSHLAGIDKKLDEVHSTVNRLCTNLHSQGVGNERTAQAVVQLQGVVRGVTKNVAMHVKAGTAAKGNVQGGTGLPTDEDERLQLATCNETEVASVRDLAKQKMLQEILGSTASFKAMPSRARALEILYSATESVRGVDRSAAEEYLASRRIFLLSDGTPSDKKIRVSEKLHRVRSHVTESLQKVAMLAYFKAMDVGIQDMDRKDAAAWLQDGKYATSKKADPAVNAALKAMFLRNGQAARVLQPKDVGDDVYVDASTGHVALVTHWARGVFEKVAGIRKPRRSGNDDGAYDCWREEVRHVSSFLRRHDDVEAGLRLCDGTDKRRAMEVADDGTLVLDASDDDVGEDPATNGGVESEEVVTDTTVTGTVGGDELVDGGGGEGAQQGPVSEQLQESSDYPEGFGEYLEEMPL